MISALLWRWGAQSAAIRTPRLRLVAITPEMLHAEPAGKTALARATRAQVPADWPPEHWQPDVWAHILAQLTSAPATFGWHRYMLSGERPQRLIGCLGGFPCTRGDVEIGYSVVNSAQRQGFGSEAAGALVRWLMEQPEVRSVSAQAYETSPASVKVMRRCGLEFVGEGDHPGTVRFRRMRGQSLGEERLDLQL